VIGAQVGPYLQKGEWQANVSMSQFQTNQEYLGTALRETLEEAGTEVIEGSTSLDLQGTYGVTQQTSVTLEVPVILNYHWSAVLGDGKRHEDTARGLSDMMLSAHRWFFDCTKHTNQNISIGLGVRMPTGNANAQWPFPNALGQDITERAVFTGAQLGSGAWGLAPILEGFKQFKYFTIFGTGSYLFSLRGQNNTYSFGAAISPAGPTSVPANSRYNSTPDSYFVHNGVAAPIPIPRLSGLSGLFAWRMVGVPVHNVFGPTTGFRQPGYFVTVEPGLNFDTKLATYSFSVPLRVAQKVEASLGSPKASDFAPHLILVSVSFNFGGGSKSAAPADAAGP